MLFLDVKDQPGHFQHSLTREDVSPDGSAPPFPLPEFILSLISLPAARKLVHVRWEKAPQGNPTSVICRTKLFFQIPRPLCGVDARGWSGGHFPPAAAVVCDALRQELLLTLMVLERLPGCVQREEWSPGRAREVLFLTPSATCVG